MPVKSDRWIIEMCEKHEMIKPFEREQVRSGISYGVSSYGYDISLSNKFKIPRTDEIEYIDPRGSSQDLFEDVEADSILIPAGSYALAQTREYFKIPREVVTICFGKSTYARSGIFVNVTPFEPEWEGFATISIANTAPLPVKVYANQGIAQLLFLEANEVCLVSYADKKGKYQAQATITTSKSD